MSFELFTNSAATTLNTGGGINNSVTSFTVASSSGFPATGNFRVICGSEIMLVTAVSGTTWTVTRGIEGTAAASHIDTSPITHILTAGSLPLCNTLSGTFANRPAAGVAGRKYYATDTPFWYLDNGSTWAKFFGSYPIVTPDDTGFSWDNQASAVLTTTKDMLNILADATSSFRYKTAPSAPYVVDAAFLMNWTSLHKLDSYLGFRASASGKMHTTGFRLEGAVVTLNSWKWTTSTSFSAAYNTNNYLFLGQGLFFLRIEDDNTNRNIYVSNDGVNFVLFHSIGRTDFLTANQIVWGAGSDATPAGSVSLVHWYQH